MKTIDLVNVSFSEELGAGIGVFEDADYCAYLQSRLL